MAELSKVIPNETRSEQRYIQPAAPAPSFLEHLANFGSNVIGVAETAMSSINQGKQNKNAAIDYAASNATAKTVWAINGPQNDGSVVNTQTNDPNHNAAVAATKAAAPQMLNAQTAGSQGAMDPGMVQAKNVAAIRQLMGQFPGHEAAIATAARELGVQNMLTQQYANAETAIESDASAQRDTTHALDKLAVTKYGYSNLYTMKPEEQDVVRANVSLQEESEAALDRNVKQADLLTKQGALVEGQNTALKTQVSAGLAQSVTDFMGKSFTNLSKVLLDSTVGDPSVAGDPTRAEALTSKALATALPALDLAWTVKMGPILNRLTPEDRAAVTEQFKMQKDSLVSMLTGPASVVEQNKRMMSEFSDKYGISFAQAAPKIMQLRQIIGPAGLAQLLDPTLAGQGNAPLMEQITKEMKGYLTSNDPHAIVDAATFLQTLSGDVDMKNLTPQKIAAMAPQQLDAMHRLSLSQTANNGTDAEAHKALVKSIGNTSWIAAGANEGWGFKNLLNQGKALTDDRVARALVITSANPMERRDAIHAWQPAIARTYESLQRVNAGDKFYDLKLDPHSLTWKPVWNGKSPTDGNQYELIHVLGMDHPGQPKPSGAVVDQAATLNHMLHRMSDTAAHNGDTIFNNKKVSYMEARKFYATGEVPNALKQPAESTKGRGGKTPEQNIDDAVSHVLDFANKLQYVDAPPSPVAQGQTADLVKTAASNHGVPEAIALRLIGRESSGNVNVHDSDKGAAGLGQIMPKTAAAYGVSDVHSLSPSEQVDLSMKILADNYKKTGNWHDAVSMYHSGVPLAKAIAQNRTDGHMRTADYVQSIVGPSTPDLDTSGIMPLGAETPYGIRL